MNDSDYAEQDPTDLRRKFRNFIGTWNNYTDASLITLRALNTRYVCVGWEIAPTTGTPHLQLYVVMHSPITVTGLRAKLLGCDVRIAKADSLCNKKYCSKTRPQDPVPNERFEEWGERPLTPQEKGQTQIDLWAGIKRQAMEGNLDDIDPKIFVSHYPNLKRIKKDYARKPQPIAGYCGLWIQGESGMGKSRAVQNAFPEMYRKPRDKWWDMYQGEDVVLFDDINQDHEHLASDLKDWGGEYPFPAPEKGGYTMLRPKFVIMTSQHKIEDIFHNFETRQALNNRFITIVKTSIEQEIDFNIINNRC